MRLRHFAIVLSGVSVLFVACSGDDEAPPLPTPEPTAATPVPTATPLARVPDPIIVTGQGAPGVGLPASEDAVQYTVESGDTLSGIAERFGVPTAAIREANDLGNDDIFIGQTLTIPRGGAPPTGAPPAPGQPPPAQGTNTYVVQPGDTAFGIALEFDTTVAALAAANGMTEDEIADLQIGQVINLPGPQ
jgi:N-acetylmuramoyl-L-alanine amidase